MKKKLDKGMLTEEILRIYFLKAGYYVARGVQFVYQGLEVTDIDLWLYSRASSISREITIVDIKNKKTPQAIERIFWVHGLKQAVKATKAVVATTEKRKEVKEFGQEIGVLVLDGQFLSKIKKLEEALSDRLTNEEFSDSINKYSLQKLDGDWKGKMTECKSLLSKELSFDSANYWLQKANFFAEQAMVKPNQTETALRCFYLICSYIALAIDYLLQEISFLENDEKINLLTEGFTYGSKGKLGTNALLDMSMSLVEGYSDGGKAISNQVRAELKQQFSSLSTPILGEFFGKVDIGKQTFQIAKEFELLAMQRSFQSHEHSSIELRSMIGCLLDFWEINRSSFTFERLKLLETK